MYLVFDWPLTMPSTHSAAGDTTGGSDWPAAYARRAAHPGWHPQLRLHGALPTREPTDTRLLQPRFQAPRVLVVTLRAKVSMCKWLALFGVWVGRRGSLPSLPHFFGLHHFRVTSLPGRLLLLILPKQVPWSSLVGEGGREGFCYVHTCL